MIAIEIFAEPRELSMSERASFEIGYTATNRGTASVDPALHLAQLSINGEVSLPWSETNGNGLREGEWFDLPPKKSVSLRWRDMGEIFFPRPGDYTLELRTEESVSRAVVVRVRP